jgi:hypothetical protein
MKQILFFFFLLFGLTTMAQIGIGTTSPDSSAILELKDSTKGILITRMTKSQRMTIKKPAEGLMIYQTDSLRGFWYFDKFNWKWIGDRNYEENKRIQTKLYLKN